MSSCCSVPKNRPASSRCIECGQKGRPVDRQTIEHLLYRPERIPTDCDRYYFCATPECGVVYFSESRHTSFHKQDVKVRVGIKENEDPIPVCYCFGHTRASMWEEIERTGNSNVVESIKHAVQEGRCECEIKNPSGRCCLGEVTRAVQSGIEQRRQVQLVAG